MGCSIDSYTFGLGLNAEDTWPEQLQEKLKVNVTNSGVLGYGSEHYKFVLDDLIKNLQFLINLK
jgi:hypothetical protein